MLTWWCVFGVVSVRERLWRSPRQWQEMRLVAAQAKDSATTVYGATFGSVEETGRRWGHVTRAAGWGLHSRIHGGGRSSKDSSVARWRR